MSELAVDWLGHGVDGRLRGKGEVAVGRRGRAVAESMSELAVGWLGHAGAGQWREEEAGWRAEVSV